VTELAERLGLGGSGRALLITADDFGLCHASTIGVLEAIRADAATSAGLLVPAPWARYAAARASSPMSASASAAQARSAASSIPASGWSATGSVASSDSAPPRSCQSPPMASAAARIASIS